MIDSPESKAAFVRLLNVIVRRKSGRRRIASDSGTAMYDRMLRICDRMELTKSGSLRLPITVGNDIFFVALKHFITESPVIETVKHSLYDHVAFHRKPHKRWNRWRTLMMYEEGKDDEHDG